MLAQTSTVRRGSLSRDGELEGLVLCLMVEEGNRATYIEELLLGFPLLRLCLLDLALQTFLMRLGRIVSVAFESHRPQERLKVPGLPHLQHHLGIHQPRNRRLRHLDCL